MASTIPKVGYVDARRILTRLFSLGRFGGVHLFSDGYTLDGSYIPSELVQELARNFNTLSSGDRPYQPVFIGIKHGTPTPTNVDGKASAGRIKTGWLTTESGRRWFKGVIVDMTPEVAKWIDDGRYNTLSVEYVDNYKDHTGKNYGHVLIRAVLLGDEPPRLLGQPLLPKPREEYAFSTRHTFSVSVRSLTMTREEAIAILSKLGLDTAWITDATPDDAIVAIANWAQSIAPKPAETPGNGVPDEMVSAFSAILKPLQDNLTLVTTRLNTVESENKAILAKSTEDTKKSILSECTQFCVQMREAGKLTPYEVEPEADKEGNKPRPMAQILADMDGPAREEMKSHISSRSSSYQFAPGIRVIEKPGVQGTGSSDAKLSEARRTELLGKSVRGKAILQLEAKK